MPSASLNGQQVTPQAGVITQLTNMAAASGYYHATTLHLNTANIVVTPQTLLSALIEATFAGYAAVAAVAFGTPGNAPPGGAEMFAPSITFTVASGTPNTTIYGWYLTDSGATTLLLYVPLAIPVQLINPGDQVVVQPAVQDSGI
jgi:hypothetical protein